MPYDKAVDSVMLDNKIKAIADKIRTKAPAPYNTKQLNFSTNDFTDAIDTLNGLKIIDNTSLTPFTKNGVWTVRAPKGEAMTSCRVEVNVPTSTTTTEAKEITITQNGKTIVEPSGNNLLSKVTVNVNVPTGGGDSNIELVEFIPPATPTFKHKTGKLELWGWGVEDAAQAWLSNYYTFHGTAYANAIDDTDHEMTLTVTDGKAYGIPTMTRGKCLAVLKV